MMPVDLRPYYTKYDPNQPSDPAGTPTGGQWTSGGGSGSKPNPPMVLDEHPNAYSVADRLNDAELPELHTDGLERIKFADDPIFTGQYDVPTRTIVLAGSGDRANKAAYGTTVVHEVGHHVYFYKLTDDAYNEWEVLSDGGKNARISSYARTNSTEHFAVAYQAYWGGKSFSLAQQEPAAHAFMKTIKGKLLPRGTFVEASKAGRRNTWSKRDFAKLLKRRRNKR